MLRNKSDKALAKKQVVPIYSCFFFPSLLRIRFNCMLRDGGGLGLLGLLMILEMANFCVQRLDELEAKFKQLEKEVQALAQV